MCGYDCSATTELCEWYLSVIQHTCMRKSLSIVITLFLFLFIIVSIANILEFDIDRAQSEFIREDLKRITIVAQLNPYQFLQVWRVMNESRSEPIKI